MNNCTASQYTSFLTRQYCRQAWHIWWHTNHFNGSFHLSRYQNCAGKMQIKEHIPACFEQHRILFVLVPFVPNFLTQLSPTVPKQQRNRQRRTEKKNYKDRKKRTNKQNSSWSPKALMKREFSSLSENFSPLQRLACITKVTASVCSFVCVCVLLLSCCLGCESGWRVCRGHKETVCVFMCVCVCLCVYVCELCCIAERLLFIWQSCPLTRERDQNR